MADIKPEQLRALITQLKDSGLDEVADKIQKRIEKGEELTRKQVNQLKKIRDEQVKAYQELLKKTTKMEQAFHRLSDAQKSSLTVDKSKLQMLGKSITAQDSLIMGSEKAVQATSKLGNAQSNLVKNMRDSATAIGQNVTAVGLLDTAIRGIEALYNRWFDLESEWTAAMGQMARTTGQSSTELRAMREEAEQLRDRMSGLGGSISGITDSVRLMSEAGMAMRTQGQLLGQDFIAQFQAMSALASGPDGAAQIFRALEGGVDAGRQSLGEFAADMQEFASGIGANATQMTQEFLDARDSLALFGEDGMDVFRRTAAVANTLGFEVRRVLEMARRFDTFGQASQNINQLNSMFGTTVSSIEMLLEEDPVARISMITDSIRDQGYEWNNMSRQQKMALADSLGVTEMEAARIMNGESMADIQREQEQRQIRQARLEENQMATQERIFEIIENTRTVFRSIWDNVQLIYNDVAEGLAPIFSQIHLTGTDLVAVFREWVQKIMQDPRFINTVERISKWISELPQKIEEFLPTWTEIEKKATEMWPTIERIGGVLMDIFDWATENPEAVGIALGVGAVLMIAAQLAPLAALIGPQGLLIAGVAALGYGFYEASQNATVLTDRMAEIHRQQSNGQSTMIQDRISNFDRNSAMNEIDQMGGVMRLGQSPAALLGNTFSRTVSGATAGLAERAGFQDLGTIIRQSSDSATAVHNHDVRGMAERAIASGHSPEAVHAMIMAQIQEDERMALFGGRGTGMGAEQAITSSMGLSAGPQLSTDLLAELNRMAGGTRSEPVSASQSSSVTSRTSSPVPAGQTTEVMIREITMDGRPFGRAVVEISKR